MKKLWLVLVLFSVVFFSCKEESTITSSGVQSKGSIAVSLDKNTTPSNVAQVKVTLTREGYSQITGVMNILTDTTAELTLNEIAAGQWSLKVDAYNAQNIIVYTGETNVTISDGMISQVNLTLYSTGNGVGGVKISVTWVNTQITTGQWVDSPNSPILTGSLYFEPNGVTAPDILLDNGIYKMWYAGAGNSARFEIGYATSTDGINWQKNNSPVLSPSYYWEERSIVSARVIKVGDTYKMYYTARDNNYMTKIGLATSSDGINWVKRSQPVLVASQNWETAVTVSSVLVINDKYYLYYTTGYYPYGNTSIGLATSYDGINFTKEPNPVIAPTLSWEGTCIHGPLVLFKDGKFIMYYLTYDTSKKIGYAESNDGINWTKSNTPVSDATTAHSTWCTGGINQLEYVKVNNEERLYYTGGIEYPAEYYKIGYLKKI